MEKKLIIDSNNKKSADDLRDAISYELFSIVKQNRPIIILCIGTDRSTGDCLGPLVGEKLKFLERKDVFLYGNLTTPIHAKNFNETLAEINLNYENPFILAVDACLGSIENVGKIFIEKGSLSPGAALNKKLPPVGNLSITGIVNVSGSLEFTILQNTRLSIVMQIANIISSGIYHSIIKTVGGNKNKDNRKHIDELSLLEEINN
ncbi:MAG: spore protease YyaC [Bacillota bacterium]|nr:spore protease YyaC [Bacillota bacterium]